MIRKFRLWLWNRRAFRWNNQARLRRQYDRLCAERWAELEREYNEAIRKLFWGEKTHGH